MRIRDLRRSLTAIILAAPLATGCVTGTCPDNPPIVTNRVIIDQHFRQRDRMGRLLTALSYNPFCVGLGVDEDTAAFIAPDETLEVVGASAVTVVDPADIAFTSIADAKPGETLTIVGARVHVLGAGSTYNLHTRRVAASVLYDSFVTGE